MTENKKLRWGMLGAGVIAHKFMKDFPLMKNARLVAVATSNEKPRGGIC